LQWFLTITGTVKLRRDINLDSLTNQQLQAGIAELDHAIYLHDQWYKNLLRVLVSRVSPEQSDLMPDAHLKCAFGKWYEDHSESFFIESQQLKSLFEAHKKVHSGARHLFQRISNGLVIPVDDWDNFESGRERMRREIWAARHEFAETLKNRDSLTEAQTRTGLLADLRKQHSLVLRGKQTYALAMLDFDHFKRINDSYGHAAGDTVLASTVQCVKSHLRPYDRIYRYGGEEFIICMPSTTLEQAGEMMERLRLAISEQHFEFGDIQVTASFGVTVLRESQTVKESINCADKAMYEAKSAGRDRVVLDV